MDSKKALGAVVGIVALAAYGGYRFFSGREPQKYSDKWFEKASDELLKSEREVVIKQFCSSGDDPHLLAKLEGLRNQFDKVLSKRAWGDKVPSVSSIHREHGWYLPNDN